MRVLGIDPGTATTGYALLDGEPQRPDEIVLVEHGVIRTAPTTPMPDRLREIHAAVESLIVDLQPDVVAIEELFFSSNITTGITVGQARGVILLAAAQAGLDIAEYKPNVVKQALTGYGAADKRQMQEMVKLLLRLSSIPRPDDAADAVAIALAHVQLGRLPR